MARSMRDTAGAVKFCPITRQTGLFRTGRHDGKPLSLSCGCRNHAAELKADNDSSRRRTARPPATDSSKAVDETRQDRCLAASTEHWNDFRMAIR